MKAVIYTMGGAALVVFAMIAWTMAASLMREKSDGSVIQGILIMAALLGMVATGVVYGVRKLSGNGEPEEARSAAAGVKEGKR